MICSYDEHVAKCMVSVMTCENQWYVMNQWYQKPVISHLTGYCVFLTSILVGCVVMSLQMSRIRKETCNRRLSLWNLSFWHKALEDRWHISCMAWFVRYFYCVFLVASSSCHYRNKLSEYSRVYLTGVPSQYPCIVLSWVAQAFKAGLVRVQIRGEGRFSTPVSTGHSPCRSFGEWVPGWRWHGASQRRAAGLIVFSCSPGFTWPCFGQFPSILLNLI